MPLMKYLYSYMNNPNLVRLDYNNALLPPIYNPVNKL